MKATETNLPDWQKRYGTEEACCKSTGSAALGGRLSLPALRA